MDCQMPVMDGFEATRRLRANPKWNDLPVIALTANVMADDRERCYLAGMNAHVAKPINMDDLYKRMAQCLPDTRAQANPPPTVRLPESSTKPAEPVGFPGINLTIALSNLDGSLPLLYRVLRRFRDGQGQAFERQFLDAHASGDWESKTRLAHSLKGVARTLGACDLGEVAAALERAALDHDSSASAALLPAVLEQLRRVTQGLGDIDRMSAPEAAPATPPIPLHELADVLERLEGMLTRQETEATDLAMELTPRLARTHIKASWGEISSAIQRYDFATARARLAQLRSHLKTPEGAAEAQ
jgi:CheY-like chemotaxis protein